MTDGCPDDPMMTSDSDQDGIFNCNRLYVLMFLKLIMDLTDDTDGCPDDTVDQIVILFTYQLPDNDNDGVR